MAEPFLCRDRDRQSLARALVAIALVVCPGCYSSTERADVGPRLDGGPADGGFERDAPTFEPDAGLPGEPCNGAIQLSPDGTVLARLGDLIADERGGLAAVFDTHDGALDGDARLVSYDPGAGWSASSSVAPAAGDPWSIVADIRADRLALAWVEDTPDRNAIATSRAGGSDFDPPTGLDGPGLSAWPDVAVDASGRVTVAWHHERAVGFSVVARRFDPASGWGAPTTLSAGPSAWFPRLVASGDETVAVWLEAGAVWARTWAGGSWGSAVRVDDGTDVGPSHAYGLDVAVDSNGVVLVAWAGDSVFVAERDPMLGLRGRRVGAREAGETGMVQIALGVTAGAADVAWAVDVGERGTAIHAAHAERGAATVWEPPVVVGTTERFSATVDAIGGSLVWSGAGSRLTVAHRERGVWTATPIGDGSSEGARIARDGSGRTWILFTRWVVGMTSVLCATRG